MGLITLIGLFFLIANMCLLYKKQVEEVISLSLFTLILILYPLGIMKQLSCIGIVLFSIDLVLYILYVFKYSQKIYFTEIYKYIFTFGALVFLCIVFCVCFLGYGRRVLSHDEFNFWATAVKSLWYHDGFASAIEVWSVWEYPQGMTLLEWFGSFLWGDYTEWTSYAIRLVFDFSLVLPMFKRFKIKWYYAPLAALFLFLFPSMINLTSYTTLSVDGDLAFLFGYLLYSVFDRNDINIFYYTRIILCSCVIILTKSFSIVFVLYGWVLLITLLIYEKRKKITPKSILPRYAHTILFMLV